MAQMNGMEKRNFTSSARNGGKTAEMRNNSAKSRMVGMSVYVWWQEKHPACKKTCQIWKNILLHASTRTAYVCLQWDNVSITHRCSHPKTKWHCRPHNWIRVLNHCLKCISSFSTHLSNSRQWFYIQQLILSVANLPVEWRFLNEDVHCCQKQVCTGGECIQWVCHNSRH